MKRKLFISFIQAVIVLPVFSILLCMIGVPIGILIAFFKESTFSFDSLNIESIYESLVYAVKVGGAIGLVLGTGLLIANVIIPIVTGKFDNKNNSSED